MAFLPLGNGKGVTWEPTTELICARCRQPFDPATSLQTVYLVHDNFEKWSSYDELKIRAYWYLHAECRGIEKVLKDMGANIRWYMHDMPYILGFTIEKDGYRRLLRHAKDRTKNFPPTVYEKLYAQWRPALGALDDEILSTVDITSLEIPTMSVSPPGGMPPSVPIPPIEKQPGYLARRFEVFRRDGYRCQICGKAASDGPHVRLEMEHKIPRAKGGSDELSNLWTCCYECNHASEPSWRRPVSPSNLWTCCYECNHGKGTKDLFLTPPQQTSFIVLPQPEEEA